MKKVVALFVFMGFVVITLAQNQQVKEHTVYLYTFENLSTQEQVDNVIAATLKIPGITEAKVNCKWESNRGELIFKVEEIITGNENSENINIGPVKQVLSENNLIPVECSKRLPR
jgi:hypothetical protein